jgi:hypothetical protein
LQATIQANVESLREYVSSRGLTLRVDREHGIIHDVKVLGLESRNGRTYTPACVSKAMPLYEGAAVFVDHGEPGKSRSYHDRMGRLEAVSAKQDGLYADFRFNPKSALAEQLLWDAENAPASVGFSHDVEAKTTRRDGKTIVEEIISVLSVDLVAKPATTRSLFEDEIVDPELRGLAESSLSAMTEARTILFSENTIIDKKARLSETIATWQSELGVANKEPAMEWKDVTVESLRENRKDLVESLANTEATTQLTAEIATLKESIVAKDAEVTSVKEQLAAAQTKEAEAAKSLAIIEELKAAKLDAKLCTAVFMEQLKSAADQSARARLIEDRATLAKLIVPTGTAAPFAAILEDDGVSKPGATAKDTLARLR